jgi:hypothetical protein
LCAYAHPLVWVLGSLCICKGGDWMQVATMCTK